MTNRITKKDIENAVTTLIRLTGDNTLSAHCSGSLWNIFSVVDGTRIGVFGSSAYYKYTIKEFHTYLNGVISGISYQLKQK